MKVLKPDVEVETSQMPKLLRRPIRRRDLGAAHQRRRRHPLELLGRRPRGADPAGRRRAGCSRSRTVLMTAGEPRCIRLGTQMPDGTVIGARGPFGVFAPDTALNKWFRKALRGASYKVQPNYASYKMAQAILGREGGVREGAGGQRRQAPEPGRRSSRPSRTSTFEGPGGHGRDGARQGPPGGAGHGLRHHQARRRQGDRRQRQALSGRAGQCRPRA